MLAKVKPYAKALVAFVAPGASLIIAAVLPGSPGNEAITQAELITAAATCVVTSAAVWKVRNSVIYPHSKEK